MFKRIAFVKLCCPGDLLFTTPAVRAVKKHFPDAELFYITGKYSSFIPAHNPHIEKNLVVRPPFEIAGILRNPASMLEGISVIGQKKFELVISFHRSRAVAAMARIGRAKRVLSFDTAKPMANITRHFEPKQHEVKRYIDLVSAIAVKEDGLQMEYSTTASEDEAALSLLENYGIIGPFAVIAPGGGENPGTKMHIKRWPVAGFRDVATHLRQSGLQVVTIGSPSERQLGEGINSDINLAGETAFWQLAPILKQAAIFIGNDSGPLYLASAAGTPTVGIYGPSSPQLVGPFNDKHRTVSNPIWCHPCYHPSQIVRGNIGCPVGTWACMLTLSSNEVISAANELLGI
jgi:heptosyltransferase II